MNCVLSARTRRSYRSDEIGWRKRAPMEKVEALQRELGRFEGRLELEAVARSTLEEQLKREQERADRERERAEQERLERQAAQEEVKQLRERLEEMHKPKYLRWFRRSRSS
jgi:chromosome segregation ATPase